MHAATGSPVRDRSKSGVRGGCSTGTSLHVMAFWLFRPSLISRLGRMIFSDRFRSVPLGRADPLVLSDQDRQERMIRSELSSSQPRGALDSNSAPGTSSSPQRDSHALGFSAHRLLVSIFGRWRKPPPTVGRRRPVQRPPRRRRSTLADDEMQAGQLEANGLALGRSNNVRMRDRQIERALQVADGFRVGAHGHRPVGRGQEIG